MKINMNIQITIQEKTDVSIIGVDATGRHYTIPKDIFPNTVAVGESYWLTISESEQKASTPKEILNELLQ